MKGLVFRTILTLLLMGVLVFSFNFQPVEAAATIYIRADGSIDPPTAPISTADKVTYTFTGNINESLVIQRDNIVVDGAGYTVQGTASGGIYLSGRVNVTVQNVQIEGFDYGIYLYSSSNNIISGNIIANNDQIDVYLYASSNNNVCGNNIANNSYYGVYLYASSNNNTVSGNNIANNYYGVYLALSSNNNTVSGNNIANNYYGVYLDSSSNNEFYHNNFVTNTAQVYVSTNSTNVWDNGYPSGGNYWSNFNSTDLFRGPYQNETGIDGISDTPYVIDVYNQDRYPLMGLTGSSTATGEKVTVFPTLDVCIIYWKVLIAGRTTISRTGTGPSPPAGRQWLDKLYDIQTTASISGKITIKIIYLDGGLSSQEEQSLLLAHWMLQGDITGPTGVPDGVVDIRDIALIAVHFGEDVPPAPPKCDITGPIANVPDGKIDIRDIALAALNFGNNQPEWINITTHLDTENNMIFGETSRLSIFGVHFN